MDHGNRTQHNCIVQILGNQFHCLKLSIKIRLQSSKLSTGSGFAALTAAMNEQEFGFDHDFNEGSKDH
jgi:hypothetical protein